MIILLHSSKTMKLKHRDFNYRQPEFVAEAENLIKYLRTLSPKDLEAAMKLSPKLADRTKDLIDGWSSDNRDLTYALDSFAGDIYSGLQVKTFNEADRQYADKHLRIISGLYGLIRPLDGISPYRLEMGYRLPEPEFRNLYKFWSIKLADSLDDKQAIINLASKEYSKAVVPYLTRSKIIEPQFLTYSAQKQAPEFVVVHAKIARGAFAHWLIKNRVDQPGQLANFADLGYKFEARLSSDAQPTFVTRQFGGLGLSVRLD
jgi:hypothetical protein